MTSNCAGAVQFPLCVDVGGMGSFGGIEVSEITRNAVYLNDGAPLSVVEVRAKKTGSCPFLSGTLILDVLSLGDVSQVANPVIGASAVDVVNVVAGELPMHVEPRKPVEGVGLEGNFHPAVAISVNVSNGGINRDAIAGFNPPRKNTSLGVVMKNFTQACCGKIGRSHDAVLSLIGQMPGGIPLPAGHRHFTTGVA